MKQLIDRFSALRVRVIWGFALVSLPLMYGLIDATHQIYNLVGDSQQAVESNTVTSILMASLYAETNELNRKAKQYIALQEDAYLKMYQQKSQQAQDAANKLLKQVKHNDSFKDFIKNFLSLEHAIYQQLLENPPKEKTEEAELIDNKFNTLNSMANIILMGEYVLQDTKHELQLNGNNIVNSLTLKVAVLLLITFFVSIRFVRSITHPLRQMEQAINRLGKGSFEQPIEIQGTSDLIKLGQRLEWLRQRLNDLEASKARFIQHISHDLKTPLTAIKEGVSLLQTAGFGQLTTDQQEIVQIVEKNSIRLQKLIEDLLNFQSTHLQTIRLDLSETRADQLILQVCDRHSLALRARQLYVDTQLAPVTISVDEEKFLNIIDNLLSNALKYAPVKSTISLQCWTYEQHIIIQIHDDGPGIDPADRPHIFEAFYQGRRTTNSSLQGSGLGLAIVQHYVHAHQGNITILDCEQGTTFQVSLPVAGPSTTVPSPLRSIAPPLLKSSSQTLVL